MSIIDPPAGRARPEFVTLIAIYQFATALILFLLACLAIAMGIPLLFFAIADAGTVAVGFVWIVFLALATGYAIASVVVGWGLLKMREWARLGALVLAAFALIGFPIWTIVAILILVYLTSDDVRAAFHAGEAAAADQPSSETEDAAPAAVYKAEPAVTTAPSPTEETREVRYVASEQPENGAPSFTPEAEETRRIDTSSTPIEMPPGDPLDETRETPESAQQSDEIAMDDEPTAPADETAEVEPVVEEEPRPGWHWQEPPRSSEPREGTAEAGEELHETGAGTEGRQEDDSEPAAEMGSEPALERDTDDSTPADDDEAERRRDPDN